MGTRGSFLKCQPEGCPWSTRRQQHEVCPDQAAVSSVSHLELSMSSERVGPLAAAPLLLSRGMPGRSPTPSPIPIGMPPYLTCSLPRCSPSSGLFHSSAAHHNGSGGDPRNCH